MNKAIFDIGGNGVQYKVNDQEIETFSTIKKNKAYVLKEMAKIINENNVSYVGISSPCGVDSKTGRLYGISGIKDYQNFNLYEELGQLISKDVKLIAHNDANAALLGNLVGENYSSAIQITIGTGIGGALYFNNEIISGKWAMAGEFGYAPFTDKLSISQMCSANSLVKLINNRHNSNYNNFREILESKKDYENEIKEWSRNVAKLIMQILFFISPEVLFISGGITNNNSIRKNIASAYKELMDSFNYSFDFKIEFKNIENSAIIGMENELIM